MADQTTPLLTLDTLVTRPVVVINGARYELETEETLSAVDLHRLRRQGARLHALMTAAALTGPEEAELGTLLDTLCRRLLVDVPDAVHATLRDHHRLAIVQTFTRLLRANRPPAGAAAAGASPTGASSSPVSSASTGATP